jgi:hypothetical protein
MSNARGEYGSRPFIGAEPSSINGALPWLVGGALATLGLLAAAGYSKRPRETITEHQKEVRAWERAFPGLPWYMDQVKDSRQLAVWERARDQWEQTHG